MHPRRVLPIQSLTRLLGGASSGCAACGRTTWTRLQTGRQPNAAVAADLRQQVGTQLRGLDAASRRAIVGAAEALLLDATRPGWRARYLAEPFALRYAVAP